MSAPTEAEIRAACAVWLSPEPTPEWARIALVRAVPVLLAALDTERAEAARLRKIFDDAGQGEYNVLALVDLYQQQSIEADAAKAEILEALRLSREQHEVCGHDDKCDYCREAREVADDVLSKHGSKS